MVAIRFDATKVEPNTALEALPTGAYPVTVTRSEMKPTRAGDGSYLELEMTVQSGEYKGRKIFDRLNLNNKSTEAVRIAQGTLSAICRVAGVLQLEESQQLHGRPITVLVSKVPRNDRPELMTNEVKGYKTIDGLDPGQVGTVSTPNAQPAWAKGGDEPASNGPYPPQQHGAPPTMAGPRPTGTGPAAAAGGVAPWKQ